MKVLKSLGNKKYLNTYSKIHQIASAADQLTSEKKKCPQLVDKNSSSHGCGSPRVAKTIFLLLTPKVIVSMMTYKIGAFV